MCSKVGRMSLYESFHSFSLERFLLLILLILLLAAVHLRTTTSILQCGPWTTVFSPSRRNGNPLVVCQALTAVW